MSDPDSVKLCCISAQTFYSEVSEYLLNNVLSASINDTKMPIISRYIYLSIAWFPMETRLMLCSYPACHSSSPSPRSAALGQFHVNLLEAMMSQG